MVGCTNEHLLKSLKYKIPIVITYYKYYDFENYTKPVTIEGFSDLDLDLKIVRRPNAFSQIALREKLLFFLEMYGLLVEQGIKNVLLNSVEKKITVYKEKGYKHTFEYEQLYLLDTSRVVFDGDTMNYGGAGNEYNIVIDTFKFSSPKKGKIYIPAGDLVPIKELYYYDDYLYCISRIESEFLEEWENSQTYLKNIFEEFLHKYFNVVIPLKVSPCERITRPGYYRRLLVMRPEITYELN